MILRVTVAFLLLSTVALPQPELEVEMPDARTLRFHVVCDGLWRVLKGTLPPTRQPRAGPLPLGVTLIQQLVSGL